MEFKDEQALVKFILNQKLPDWKTSLYKKNSEAVQVHSHGQIFYKLDRLFPNEHPESKAHRILAFEPITEASFGRAANNVNRIFKNSSYAVEASEKTLNVLAQDDFEGQDFYSYFLDEWVAWAMKEDPNARIVIYPPEYLQGNEQVKFISSDYLKFESKEVVVFISEAESQVEYELQETCVETSRFYDQSLGRYNVKESTKNTYTPKFVAKVKRPVYHAFVLGVGFYRIEQIENDATKYSVELFPIKQDFIPVIDVGGDKSVKDVNKSFLHPFVAFGNLALLQHSQHTAVNFIFSFPKMSELESPCEAEGCHAGKIESDVLVDTTGEPLLTNCKRCGGTGYTTNQTPYKVYKRRYDANAMEGDEKILDVDDVKYYTPPTAILDYSKGEWKDYLEMAETAVYIQQKVQTGNVEAAKSKEIDREDLYAFLTKVAQVFFPRLRFAIQCYENYLVSNPTQVSLTTPYSFAIVSEEEAFSTLKMFLESNVPIMLKANQVESFVNKFVSMTSPVRRALDVLKLVDPLLYYTNAELAGYKLAGVVSPEQLSIHVYAFPTLYKMYSENKQLFSQDTKTIANKVLAEVAIYKPEPPQDLKTKFTPVA